MKMDTKLLQKFDKQKIRQILEFEDEFISTLFDSFEVPESIEGKSNLSINLVTNQKILIFFIHR